ncbi:MAG: roadblock/LC7 domain-containing protein [Prochloraceae cyanobacterium]|nr:roadblock/LC7 domain-containing protein [Prochloraceae cyanobacterium]
MIQASALKEQLENFIRKTPDVEGALLVTYDGLSIASVIPSNLDEERTSAMSAAMLSLGDRIARELNRGVIERILVSGEKGYSILVGCGEDILLLTLANSDAKEGILFLSIKRLVQEIQSLLKD